MVFSPNYSHLHVFGITCFVLLQPHEHDKLQPRSHLCCFLGYGIEHRGYKCYDPISKRLRIVRPVLFWEHKIFTHISSFHLSIDSTPSFFTNSSIKLFPSYSYTPIVPSLNKTDLSSICTFS